MPQAPSWLPYRIRSMIDQQRILFALRGLDRTRPYPAVDRDQADIEISMLLCRRDVALGILACKSLLRFDDVKYAVTFINDGSLPAGQIDRVNRHIPNAAWETWKEPSKKLAAVLDHYPNLGTLYESNYEPIAKLMHPMVEPRCERVINLDSDTAFLRRPDRIIAFAKGDDARPLYLHDHQDEAKVIGPAAHEAFEALRQTVAPDRQWQLQHRFFNAGTLIFRPDQLDLDLAEAYLDWLKTAPERFKQKDVGTWFVPWKAGCPEGREQTAYMTMYALGEAEPEPLGDDYWIGYHRDKVFCHFLRHYVVRPSTLGLLRRVIDEL